MRKITNFAPKVTQTMKLYTSLISFLLLTFTCCTTQKSEHEASEETTQESAQEFANLDRKGNSTRLPYTPSKTNDRAEQIIEREAYTLSYNKEWVNCNWVYWKLTRDHCTGNNQRDNEKFVEDDEVKGRKATHQDYVQSGYDRGHMCPAGDNKWSKTALSQTFKLSNICPQNHNLNTGDWNDLEQACRFWAKTYGEVYIVCGPIYYNGVKKRLKNKVGVPDAFFKCVVRLNANPSGLGFIYDNSGKHNEMSSYVCTIDEVERTTGLDLFKGMPNESYIESNADFNSWRHFEPDYSKKRDRNKFDNTRSGGKKKNKKNNR